MAFLLSLHSEVKDPGLLDLISRLTSLLLQIEVSGCRGTQESIIYAVNTSKIGFSHEAFR